MAIMEACPQCHQSIKFPHARLVQDDCGHKKCRICLLTDEDGCRLCAEKKRNNAIKKNTSKRELTHHPASTRKRRKKIISSEPEYRQNSIHEEDQVKTLHKSRESKDKLILMKTEEKSDNLEENHVDSEPNDHSPSVIVQSDVQPKIENVDDDNNNERQSVSESEEDTLEVKDDRKRKPLQIASHITITPGNPTAYTCTICVKTFSRREHIHYHNFCATGDKPFKCEFCNQRFVTRSHYDCHILNHTGDRPFICETCNKGFMQKDKLTRHIRIHTGEKPYVCQTCGRSFSTSHSLKGHYRTHTGEKPYLCTQCGRRFAEQINLRNHLVVHTGEKNFICEDCGKRFGLKYSLLHHQKTHSRDRPFWCHKCCRGFITKKQLNRHSIVHSDARPYSCSICELSFRRKDNLERHMKNTHPETRMVNYGQFAKEQPLQQKNTSNEESVSNSGPSKTNSKADKEDAAQHSASHVEIGNENEDKAKNSQAQKTSCIKSVSRTKANDKEKTKLYVELVVPPSLLRKPPEVIEEATLENKSEKSKKLNAMKDVNKTPNPIKNVNVMAYREKQNPIHSSNIMDLGSVHNLSVADGLNHVRNFNVRDTMNDIQDFSAIGTINQVEDLSVVGSQDLSATGTLNLIQNVGPGGKINSMQDLNISETLNPVQDLSSTGALNTLQNYSDMGTLNSVQDLSISSYNPTNVTSFKQMLDPINSTSSYPGASLFQEIPDAVQQKSQAVPVINSPITQSYSMMNYEGNPRTSDSTNYSNMIYNDELNSLPLSYSALSYERDLDPANISSSYPAINYIPRPIYREKIIIESTNCVPTITKASNVFPTSVSTTNVQQAAISNVTTNNQRYFSCKKTGKVLDIDTEIPFTPTRPLQSDLHWRKRTVELSQQEQMMNEQIELDWKKY